MNLDTEELQDLAKELKNDENENVIRIFEEFAKDNNISEEELEQILSKKYDCFKCESCNKFYCYDEYSYFDEKCIYCCDVEDEEEY
jgi:energy-converting hydrogenase A subunit M